jgi:hypothetical protein
MKGPTRFDRSSKILLLLFLGWWLCSAALLAVVIGDRVQLTGGTIVRSTPAGALVGSQPGGAQGGVLAGPTLAILNGVPSIWWNVNFDLGVNGWVQDSLLTVLIPPAPVLASPGSPISPGSGVYTTGPTLTWTAVNGATNYGVSVRDLNNGVYAYSSDSVGNVSSLTLPTGTLAFGGSYYWFARAQDSAGFGPNSAVLYFQVQVPPPSPPALVSPGTTNGPGPTLPTLTPTLSWSISAAATNYGAYIYDINAHIYIYYNDALGNLTGFTLPSGVLTSGSSYLWQARASNAAGFSAYSAFLYFQTQAALPTLRFGLSGTNLVLAWPTNSMGFTLENTPSLVPPTWSPASPSPVVVNANFTVTNSTAGSAKFFRLRKSL